MSIIHGSGDLFKDYEKFFKKLERDMTLINKSFENFGEFSPVSVIFSTRPEEPMEKDWGKNHFSLLSEISLVGKLRKSGLGVRESTRHAGNITKTFLEIITQLFSGEIGGSGVPVTPQWSSPSDEISSKTKQSKTRGKKGPKNRGFRDIPRAHGAYGAHRRYGAQGTPHGAYGRYGAQGTPRGADGTGEAKLPVQDWNEYLKGQLTLIKKHENQPLGSEKYQELRKRVIEAEATPASIMFGDTIPQDFTKKDVDNAYRKIAILVHPDRNPGNQEAGEIFKICTEAKNRLIKQLVDRK